MVGVVLKENEKPGQCPYCYDGELGWDTASKSVYCMKCGYKVLIHNLPEIPSNFRKFPHLPKHHPEHLLIPVYKGKDLKEVLEKVDKMDFTLRKNMPKK